MKKIRYFLVAILILIAFFVVFPKFKSSLSEIPDLLAKADKILIWFMILFQLASYFFDGILTKILLQIAGYRIRFKDTLKISVIDTIANLALPIVGGQVIKYYFYKKLNVSSAAILFLITSWTMFFYFTALLFFVISIFFVPNNSSLISINLVLFFLVVIISALYFLIKKGNRFGFSFLNFLIKVINYFLTKFKIGKIISQEKLKIFVSNLRQTFTELKAAKKYFFLALFFSFLYYLFDILTIYFAFLVFGFTPSIFLVIFGFTISSVLSFLTTVPYIPGVVESSLALVFVRLGFPAHISLLAALLFRIFSYWLPMPIGIVSYFDFKRESGKDQKKEI
jgi:uncharacterized protein (TIRG00374 family)